MRFGIIGFGRFGRLWANEIAPFARVLVFDKVSSKASSGHAVQMVSMQEATQTEVLFLMVPISEFAETCRQIKPFLHESTLVVDCCSVKMYPVEVMRSVFSPKQSWLATHPLFGPDSTAKNGGLAGQKIVFCESQARSTVLAQLREICEKMGLRVIQTSAEAHDRNMANSQSLIHFLGRGLDSMISEAQILTTPDFQALLQIKNTAGNDSWQLFVDMQTYNVFAKEMRHALIKRLIAIDEQLGQG